MNILLSGGWGYGNLGDDALLEASIVILRQVFPDSKITIMTYNPFDCIKGTDDVVPSLHRAIYGERAYKQLRIYEKSWNYDKYPSLIARVINKIDRTIEPYRKKSDTYLDAFKADVKAMSYYKELFASADMFVMSGGGYFNSWEDSFNSRYMELSLAVETNTPIYILGQTIGPLTEQQTKIIAPLMKQVKAIYVRDVESQKDLKAMGCESIVAPDMALSYIGSDELQDRICVIPAEYPIPVRQELIKALAEIAISTRMPMVLTATRLYNRDVNCLHEIYSQLRKQGIDVTMVLPENFEQVKQTIKGCKYVISRNLHGLILGWREGANVLCLCDERKFVSFMKQIGHEDSIVDVKTATSHDIMRMFNSVMKQDAKEHSQKQKEIADDVLSACNVVFKQ